MITKYDSEIAAQITSEYRRIKQGVCELCKKPSDFGFVHPDCENREQMRLVQERRDKAFREGEKLGVSDAAHNCLLKRIETALAA